VALRKFIVFLADLHCASKVGLLIPGTELYDENGETYEPCLTDTQKWLYECYKQDIQAVKDLVGDDEISVVINGDITNGTKYPEHLVDDNIYNQTRIAAKALEPWLGFSGFKSMRFIHGTRAHELPGCATSALVAEAMRVYAPSTDIKVARHALFDVGIDTIDAAHHGPSPRGGINRATIFAVSC